MSGHLSRAERLSASTRKLQPSAHFAAMVEGYMHSGTHLLNALLHQEAITAPDEDVVHTNMPYIAVAGPHLRRVREATAALRVIEEMRILYVRGNVAVDDAAVADLLDAMLVLQRLVAPYPASRGRSC